MLVSSSEGFAREGLVAAILLRALMVVVVVERSSRFEIRKNVVVDFWKVRLDLVCEIDQSGEGIFHVMSFTKDHGIALNDASRTEPGSKEKRTGS